jgi:plasmid replication initiation protein
MVDKMKVSHSTQLKITKVYQSNELVEAHYKQEYSVQEQRTVLWLIGEVHKIHHLCKIDGKNYEHRPIRITAKDYAKIMGIDVNNVYRDAQKISRNLMEKVIKIENERGWEMFHWVSSMKYINHEAVIEVTLSEAIIPHIIDLERYTEFKLSNILYLGSSHAIKIYQLLAQYKSSGERTISVSDFRSMLGISDMKTYNSYGALKQKILKIAKREINEKTDLTISYSEIKPSRKVESIKFKITQKEKHTPTSNCTTQNTKLSTSAFETAKELAKDARTGWDVYAIEQQFHEYINKKGNPENLDSAFIGFVKKKILKPA